MVYALGQIKEVIQEPGLKFKLPPPFQNVVFLDRRIQTLDSPETAADLHRREEEPGDRLAASSGASPTRASSSATTASTCATSRRG